MDIPTHERFQTPFVYPLSLWTVQGISWGHPLIFWPNWIALVGTQVFLALRYRHPNPPAGPQQGAGETIGQK